MTRSPQGKAGPTGGWAFRAGMRRGALGWRGSAKAIDRLKQATKEIKAATKTDPVRAGEGVVVLAERIWPAFEQIDTSTGALGTAVNRTLDELIPILIAAPADEPTRAKWVDRLIDAIQDDGVDYLAQLAERFGAIAAFPALMNHVADDTIGVVRSAWTAAGFAYTALAPVCLSCLLEAGRYDDLNELLALKRNRFWPDERFAAEALLRQGKPEEALAFAEAVLREAPNGHYGCQIAQFCERVLIGLGRTEEAYRRYALPTATGSTYLATWRALCKRYPDRPKHAVLADLIEAHGEKGKWFAAAKTAGCLDIALDCAGADDADPRTLIRAARDFAEKEPRFAANVALRAISQLLAGRGYDTVPDDAADAVQYLREAARRIDGEAWAVEAVERMMAESGPFGEPFLPALRR
ncbi:MAG: hypothetical protein V2I82_01505, partial [Halieaceae bacterium]|nr:hypothetical protein [Halieaceae bacterium]